MTALEILKAIALPLCLWWATCLVGMLVLLVLFIFLLNRKFDAVFRRRLNEKFIFSEGPLVLARAAHYAFMIGGVPQSAFGEEKLLNYDYRSKIGPGTYRLCQLFVFFFFNFVFILAAGLVFLFVRLLISHS